LSDHAGLTDPGNDYFSPTFQKQRESSADLVGIDIRRSAVDRVSLDLQDLANALVSIL
jgi:hypothetical protein